MQVLFSLTYTCMSVSACSLFKRSKVCVWFCVSHLHLPKGSRLTNPQPTPLSLLLQGVFGFWKEQKDTKDTMKLSAHSNFSSPNTCRENRPSVCGRLGILQWTVHIQLGGGEGVPIVQAVSLLASSEVAPLAY